jgi:hypothetical protein
LQGALADAELSGEVGGGAGAGGQERGEVQEAGGLAGSAGGPGGVRVRGPGRPRRSRAAAGRPGEAVRATVALGQVESVMASGPGFEASTSPAHHGRAPSPSRQRPRRARASGVSECTIHAWTAPNPSEMLMSQIDGECLADVRFVGPPTLVARRSVTPSAIVLSRTRRLDGRLQDEGFRSLRQA